MGLQVYCKECKANRQPQHGRCPECRSDLNQFSGALPVLAVLVVMAGFFACPRSKPTAPPRDPTPATSTSSQRIANPDHFGCVSREFFDKLGSYVAQGDKEAFQTALALAYVDGRCVSLKVGTEVFVVDSAFLSGVVKIRIKGELRELWTNAEAIAR